MQLAPSHCSRQQAGRLFEKKEKEKWQRGAWKNEALSKNTKLRTKLRDNREMEQKCGGDKVKTKN